MPMSGLELLIILAIFAAVLWPSKKGRGVAARLRGLFSGRSRTAVTRLKGEEMVRPAPPVAVKPATPPAVRIGKTRRPYLKAKAGAAGRF